MIRFVRACLVSVVVASSFIKLHASDAPVIVGILEDLPGKYVGETNMRAIRVVFRKNDKVWSAFPNYCPNQDCLKTIPSQYPANGIWTITFDGRKLGEVTTQIPENYENYDDVGMQEIVSNGAIPTIGTRSRDYSGFLSTPVLRPLVADSLPYFKDPDFWKPRQLPTSLVQLVRKEFRHKFPEVTNCDSPNDVAKPWIYKDGNIKILKVYSSNKKWFLIQARLEESRCDGPAEDAFEDQWFVISPKQEIKFLDRGMWLVDAGDYDNDGKSELVFSIDRYNRGGYELFYDDFTKSATFEFSYH